MGRGPAGVWLSAAVLPWTSQPDKPYNAWSGMDMLALMHLEACLAPCALEHLAALLSRVQPAAALS